MCFKKKSKTKASMPIDSLDFISAETKAALRVLDITETAQLVGKTGDDLHLDYSVESGGAADKVMLCEMRTAAYFANNLKPDPKKLRWWYWKDTTLETDKEIK